MIFVIATFAGTYTSASVTIKVPKIACNSTLVKNDGYDEQYMVWGVFSDGYDSSDLAGVAVTGECLLFQGAIYSFYQVGSFTSQGSGNAPWSPAAGEKVQLSFKVSGSKYHFSILDQTQYRYNYTT